MKKFFSNLVEEKTSFSLFVVPMYFFAVFALRNIFEINPFSVEEVVMLVVVFLFSTILFYFFLDKDKALKGSIFSLSVFILFLDELLSNKIDNTIYFIVEVAVISLFLIFFIIEFILILKEKRYDNLERSTGLIIFIFGLIISIFFIESVIVDFGSQWIWLNVIPLVSLLIALGVLFDGEISTFIFSNKTEELISAVLGLSSFATITVGIVSTLYQFWFSFIFGYVFWKMFITTIITISCIIIVIFILKKNIKKKRDKKEEEEEIRKEEKRKKQQEEEEEIARQAEEEEIIKENSLRKALKTMNKYTPKDVYKAISVLSNPCCGGIDIEFFYEIFSKFEFLLLIKISIGHEKIFWNNKLENLFNFVFNLMLKIKEDEKLLVLSKKIVDLTKEVEKHHSFFGYRELKSYDSYTKLKNKSEKILKNLEK